jgi:hypothetical protein
LIAVVLTAGGASSASAQVQGLSADAVKEVVIHPAPAPRPAWKYRLLPPLSEQSPGVAAPLYAQAFLAMQERKVDEATWEKLQGQWPYMPLAELPREDLRKALEQLRAVLECVEAASRRPRYGVELTPRDYAHTLPTLRPQLAAFRALAELLVVRTRLQVLDGDVDGAVRSLRAGYALSRHCAEQPTVPHALLGISLAGAVTSEALEVVQMPGAPNLYWPLTALPERCVDLRPVFDFDALVFDAIFQEYARFKAGGATAEQWRALLDKIADSPPWWHVTGPQTADTSPAARKQSLDALLPKVVPIARRLLQADGIAEKTLGQMPPPELVVRAALETYQRRRDEMAKWCSVPFWQARRAVEAEETETERLAQEAGVPWEAVPEAGNILLQVALKDRKLAALRCLEAIRLYAASHDGKLPERLEDITDVPIPHNPFTGKPFRYRSEERYVILDLDSVLTYQWWIRLADR